MEQARPSGALHSEPAHTEQEQPTTGSLLSGASASLGPKLLQRKIARRIAGRAATPVQHQAGGLAAGGDPAARVHEAAASGLSDAPSTLPHRDAIQRSFGPYDVGGIDAHVGGSARQANEAMGAEAYATGNSVAFKDSPSLHTAAHEAAHVVQQRAGVVSLQGGVGAAGDAYEQHADAVADAVTQGQSAVGILDQMTTGARADQGGPTATQRKAAGPIQFYRMGGENPKDSAKVKGWRVGETEQAAVSQETSEGGYQLYSTDSLISSANAALTAAGSGILIKKAGGAVKVADTNLVEARPVLNPKVTTPDDTKLKEVNAGTREGDDGTKTSDKLGLWTDCGRASRVVTGGYVGAKYQSGGKDAQTSLSGNPASFSDEIYLKTMPEFLADAANLPYLVDGVHFKTTAPDYAALAGRVHKAIDGIGTDEDAVYGALRELKGTGAYIDEFKRVYKSTYGTDVVDDIKGDFSGTDLATALAYLSPSSTAPAHTIIKPLNAKQARAQFTQLKGDGQGVYAARFGINEGANPAIGETYTMATEYDMPGYTASGFNWNFHWAGVIMKDGGDNVTLEGYAINPAAQLKEAREKYAKPEDAAKLKAELDRIRKWAAEYVDRDFRLHMYGTKDKGQTFHTEHANSGTHGSRQSTFAAGK